MYNDKIVLLIVSDQLLEVYGIARVVVLDLVAKFAAHLVHVVNILVKDIDYSAWVVFLKHFEEPTSATSDLTDTIERTYMIQRLDGVHDIAWSKIHVVVRS